MSFTDPTGRLARWSLYLQSYEFTIIHRKGSSHNNVDVMSRPILLINKDTTTNTENEDVSNKFIEPYEDLTLLYYLEHGKHKKGISKTQVKRIEQIAKRFKIESKRSTI